MTLTPEEEYMEMLELPYEWTEEDDAFRKDANEVRPLGNSCTHQRSFAGGCLAVNSADAMEGVHRSLFTLVNSGLSCQHAACLLADARHGNVHGMDRELPRAPGHQGLRAWDGCLTLTTTPVCHASRLWRLTTSLGVGGGGGDSVRAGCGRDRAESASREKGWVGGWEQSTCSLAARGHIVNVTGCSLVAYERRNVQ